MKRDTPITNEDKAVERVEFAVGDVVFWANHETEHIKEICPICFGKLKVKLILGNDDEAILDCDFCKKGYDNPRGFIYDRYKWTSKVEPKTITSKTVTENDGLREVKYKVYNAYPDSEDLFATREEAEVRSKELIEIHAAEEQKNLERRKEYSKNSYGWHAGYHKKQAEKARRDLEYHEKKVVFMKKLSKDVPRSTTESTSPPTETGAPNNIL